MSRSTEGENTFRCWHFLHFPDTWQSHLSSVVYRFDTSSQVFLHCGCELLIHVLICYCLGYFTGSMFFRVQEMYLHLLKWMGDNYNGWLGEIRERLWFWFGAVLNQNHQQPPSFLKLMTASENVHCAGVVMTRCRRKTSDVVEMCPHPGGIKLNLQYVRCCSLLLSI